MVLVLERDRVLAGGGGVRRRVGGIARNLRNRRRPAAEHKGLRGRGVLRRIGGLHDVRRRRPVVVLRRGDFRVVLVLERDRVLAERLGILRVVVCDGDDGLVGKGHDLVGAGGVGPPGELVGVLGCFLLGQLGAIVGGSGVGNDAGGPAGGGGAFVEEGNEELARRGGQGLARELADGAGAGEGDARDLVLGGGEGNGGGSADVLKRVVADLEGDGGGGGRVVEGHRHGVRGALDGRCAGECKPREVRRVRSCTGVGAGPTAVFQTASPVRVDADRGLGVDPADLGDAGELVGSRKDRVGDHDVHLSSGVGWSRRRVGERLRFAQLERERLRVAGAGLRRDGAGSGAIRHGPVVREVRHGAREEAVRRGGGRDEEQRRGERREEGVPECFHGNRGSGWRFSTGTTDTAASRSERLKCVIFSGLSSGRPQRGRSWPPIVACSAERRKDYLREVTRQS